MRGQLVLKNVIIRLKLGSKPFEKISSSDIPVDIVWSGETAGGMSIDYTHICEILARFAEKEYDYIEELTSDILKTLVEEYPAGNWKVTVTKPFPPVSLKIKSVLFTMESGKNA
ncbi:MAG: dihydroneopterin aldolase [Candidatus Aegiribacteria sp.]|nr:dihydroneopterin aldolase [Candidatus Aegiribacteria sp.]